MANQCTTIALHSSPPFFVEEQDPFNSDKLIRLEDSDSQLVVSQEIPTPLDIKDQISEFKALPTAEPTTEDNSSPADYEFISRVDFNREKFFKEVCHIVKPEQDLIKETLKHFQTKSKERPLETQTEIKAKQATEQKRRMPKGLRGRRPGTLGSNIIHRIQSKRILELKKPPAKLMVKKFKSPVVHTQQSRAVNINIAALLKNSRKDSLLNTQRKSKSRRNSNVLPIPKKINVYPLEVGKREIASNIQSRSSPFKTHDLELKDPSNNLYTNRAGKTGKELKELSEILEIGPVCRFDDVITSVKKLKGELDESKILVRNLTAENELLKMRVAIHESSMANETKLLERPTVQANYHSNSKYVQPSFMSKNTASRDYKQAPYESTISMTSGPEQFEKGFNPKKNSLSSLAAVHTVTTSGQLRKLKRVLASKASSNLHSMLDGHVPNHSRNFAMADRTQ